MSHAPVPLPEAALSRHVEDAIFRRLVERSCEFALFILDPDGRVATWNAGAELIKGYTSDQIMGRHFREFYTPADVKALKPEQELETASREGRFEEDGIRVRRDGSHFWARVVITSLRDDDGVLIGFAKFTRDITEQRRVNDLFRLALEAAPTGMLMIASDGEIVLVNTEVERLFGYHRSELIGAQMETLVPETRGRHHPDFKEAFFADAKSRAMGAMRGGPDLFGRRKDGTALPIEIGLTPLHTADGQFVLCSIVDISKSKVAEEERQKLLDQLRMTNANLTATLRERDVLLREIHHRVKNNLQVIASMINMQVRRMADGEASNALRECQNRVQAIALIHEKLYESSDYSRIPFAEYARSLATSIFDAARLVRGLVTLELTFDDVALTVEKAIPTGLILNELVTNALKHAFPDGRHGVVRVVLARAMSGHVTLSVQDDGVGLPSGFDLHESKSLGLQIVSTLAQQLKGALTVKSDSGASFQVTFDEASV